MVVEIYAFIVSNEQAQSFHNNVWINDEENNVECHYLFNERLVYCEKE
jgi:hypothetical protein